MNPAGPQILIAGAGPTGLALAWLLHKAGKDVLLIEASSRPGGNVRSEWQKGHLLEYGPNSLRMTDALHAFLVELGLQDQILMAHPKAKRRYVAHQKRLRPLPGGPLSFLFGSFFPWSAKLSLLRERNLPPATIPNETADELIRRRFGDFAADHLLAPFVSGIYAGDARRLIASIAFPTLVEAERTHGSILRGMFKQPKQQHKGVFSFPDGLQTLTDRIAADLGPRLRLDTPLRAIRQAQGGWEAHFGGQALQVPAIALCMPAHTLAPLLESLDPELSTRLANLHYPPVTLVHRVMRRADIPHPLDGFGVLNVPGQDAFSLGTIFSSSVFPSRHPQDQVLLTTMVGGAIHPTDAQRTDHDLLFRVSEEQHQLFGLKGTPLHEQVTRYRQAIPQYDAQAIGLTPAADRWAQKGLHLAGNWTRGISVPDCIQNARRLCEQLKGLG